MTEEIQDVNQTDANQADVQQQTEQVNESADDVTSTTDGKDYKAMYESVRESLRKEREEKKALKTQVQQPVQAEALPEDEATRRFLRTEANAEIAVKLQTDPFFKENVDAIKEYVEKGHSIDQATTMVKADILDTVIKLSSTEQQEIPKPKQINTQATPEPQEYQPTGDHLKDFLNDPNVPEAAKESARRYF